MLVVVSRYGVAELRIKVRNGEVIIIKIIDTPSGDLNRLRILCEDLAKELGGSWEMYFSKIWELV